MTFNPQFASYNLNASNGIDVMTFEELRPRRTRTTPNLSNGSVLTSQKRGGTTIRFKLRVFGDTPADMETNLDNLMQVISRPVMDKLYVFDLEWMYAVPSLGSVEVKASDQGALAFANLSFISYEDYA